MRCLSWRFDAWSGEFVDLFFPHIGNDFAEIRNLLADVGPSSRAPLGSPAPG